MGLIKNKLENSRKSWKVWETGAHERVPDHVHAQNGDTQPCGLLCVTPCMGEKMGHTVVYQDVCQTVSTAPKSQIHTAVYQTV